MKSFKVILFTLLAAQGAFAGGGETGAGNGGIGEVCRDASGAITRVTLLDLLEAEYADELRLISAPKDDWETLALVNKQLPIALARNNFESAFLKVMKGRKPSRGRFGLPDPADYKPRITIKEPGCRWEVIGLYDDRTETLRYDSEIFEKMDTLQRQAFFVHEAVYKVGRTVGKNNSNLARLIVGQLFAENGNPDVLWQHITAPGGLGLRVACKASYGYGNPKEEWITPGGAAGAEPQKVVQGSSSSYTWGGNPSYITIVEPDTNVIVKVHTSCGGNAFPECNIIFLRDIRDPIAFSAEIPVTLGNYSWVRMSKDYPFAALCYLR